MAPLTRWTLALTPPGACETPAQAALLIDWIDAAAPGTTAAALRAAGRPYDDLFGRDVWWRTTLEGAGPRTLRFKGLATLCEVWLDDRLLLASESMFLAHAVDVELKGGETLWLAFRALAPRLEAKLLRARWKTRITPRAGLRGVRTTLMGQMPGWQPQVDCVGPWRGVALVDRGPVRLDDVRIQAERTGAGGRLQVSIPPSPAHPGEGRDPVAGAKKPEIAISTPSSGPRSALGPGLRRDERMRGASVQCAGVSATVSPRPDGCLTATLDLPHVRPWQPATHGDQPLYPVTLDLDGETFDLGPVGFRSIAVDRGADGKGFGVVVNGEPVFARGACWTTPDLLTLTSTAEACEPALRLMVEAGMNMVRLPGVGAYEADAFYDLCDELGLMVWQDFAFANFDYPVQDPAFAALCESEARQLLARIAHRPSLAVLCGGSEIAQQAAMMGLPGAARTTPLADGLLADVAAELAPGLPYVPHSPGGGDLPFTVGEGVGHYYGVGAYRRPLEDARRAGVRFAAECLAFANVPQGDLDPNGPAWKAGVPRDVGADWDFDDVRDHYLRLLFGEDAAELRARDPRLYLDLSRRVSAEVMEATFAEWRRPASPTRGALVWTVQDVVPGAGWGVLDARGEPKAAYHGLKRALRPVQLSITDEGVDGLALHLLNETAAPVEAQLTLAALAEGARPVVRCGRAVVLPPRSAETISAFALLGAFYDFGLCYNFGSPAHDVVVARLAIEGGETIEAVHYPRGRRLPRPASAVAATLAAEGGAWVLTLATDRLVEALWLRVPGFRPSHDGFPLIPGAPRPLGLRPLAGAAARPSGVLYAEGGAVLARF